MNILNNPHRGVGLISLGVQKASKVSGNVNAVRSLLQACPVAFASPLVDCYSLAKSLNINSLHIKDERERMGLGSFKSLGATYAIAKAAVAANGGQIGEPEQMADALSGKVYVTASAGNHGISTAAGARIFGAKAIIYLAETVPSGFAEKLTRFGAEVVIEGNNYEASHEAAVALCETQGHTLIADSTWEGYSGGRDIMEGYLAMPEEASVQIPQAPTHIFLQAGVGGLAAAAARHARDHWGDDPVICVVEPSAAPALFAGIEAGGVVHAAGPVSNMGRLDCKEASLLALDCLAKEADAFMTIDDEFVAQAITQLEAESLETSPSGGAGFAGLVAAVQDGVLGINDQSRVLIYLSEGPSD